MSKISLKHCFHNSNLKINSWSSLKHTLWLWILEELFIVGREHANWREILLGHIDKRLSSHCGLREEVDARFLEVSIPKHLIFVSSIEDPRLGSDLWSCWLYFSFTSIIPILPDCHWGLQGHHNPLFELIVNLAIGVFILQQHVLPFR